jgi:hypothetical protein
MWPNPRSRRKFGDERTERQWVAEFEGFGEDFTRDSLHAGLFNEEKGILLTPGSTLR